jgi:acetoin utilization deacetylase AcuC-like enzyme
MLATLLPALPQILTEPTMTKSTGLIWHELMMWFDAGTFAGLLRAVYPVQAGEPSENPEAKRRIKNLLDASGFSEKLTVITPKPATEADILRVHTPRLVEQVKGLSTSNGGQLGMSSWIGPGGYECALMAAGSTMAAVDGVLTGRLKNAYALVRPPGHHAMRDSGLGFCVFNNIAVAIRHAQARHGIRRIAVVDWDVHHGNGTQEVFYEDPDVLTISMHQDGLFPHAHEGMHGAVTEQGAGKGVGSVINVPLPPGSGTSVYHTAFDRVVLPSLDAFKPELIIVACGLDAGNNDALGRMTLGPDDFRWMTAAIMHAADRLCQGRIVFSHEGGYHAPTAPFLALPIFEQLSGLESGIVNPTANRMRTLPKPPLYAHQEAAIEEARAQSSLLARA